MGVLVEVYLAFYNEGILTKAFGHVQDTLENVKFSLGTCGGPLGPIGVLAVGGTSLCV